MPCAADCTGAPPGYGCGLGVRVRGWGWRCPPGGGLAGKTRETTEPPTGSTHVLCGYRSWFGLATVKSSVGSPSGLPDSLPPPWLLDRQGWSSLLAGALLLPISSTTNYGDDNLFQLGALPAHDQVGMGLHLAALAALAGDAQLATRLRHRARNREAEEREQATRRSRIQDGCLVTQYRFLLADTSRNRLQLSEALAVLLQELMPQKA